MFQIRLMFVEYICAGIIKKTLPTQVNCVLFLAAHDPENELKQRVQTHFNRISNTPTVESRHLTTCLMIGANSYLKESRLMFLRFLHLLSHHPDFGLEIRDLELLTTYIEFFIQCIVNSDNVSWFYYLSNRIKSVRDLHSNDSDVLILTLKLTFRRYTC